jgi:hypothetical protein
MRTKDSVDTAIPPLVPQVQSLQDEEHVALFSKLLAKVTEKDVKTPQTALRSTGGREIVRGNNNSKTSAPVHPPYKNQSPRCL